MPRGDRFPGSARYRPLRRLGAGSMGVVWAAEDRLRGGQVALKTLHWTEGEHLYRLKAEFRGLRDIAHPHLVQLLELTAGPEGAFFTMELLDGVDLVRFTRAGATERGGGALTELEAQALRGHVRQLVEGIAALHRAGRLHRDIKPTNTLITREGRAVLLDFGLSAPMDADAKATDRRLVGTIAYMAPEQGLSGEAAPPADWFALGCVLYEALTGERAFGGTLVEALAAKQAQAVRPPAAVAPGTPSDLSALVMRLLAPDPRDRPDARGILAAIGVSSPELEARGHHLSPLAGREAEQAALQGALAAVSPGMTGIVEVAGPPGIGASSLVAAWTRVLARDGRAVVLSTRCHPREQVPFRALDGLVDALSQALQALPAEDRATLAPPGIGALVRLFPVLTAVPDLPWEEAEAAPERPGDGRLQAARALGHLLGALAVDRPLVLWIDDARWGDADSGRLLRAVLGDEGAPPALLVLTGPASTPGALRAALGAAGGTLARVVLKPLGRAASRRVVAEQLGVPDEDARVAALAAAGGGVPAHLVLLARHAADMPGPSTAAAVAGALAALPGGARRLVEVVATATEPVEETVAAVAAGLGTAGPATVARAVAEGLVRWEADDRADGPLRLAAADATLAAGVRAAVPGAERTRLADARAQAARVLGEAGGTGDPTATCAAADAAAAAGAAWLAAALYERVLVQSDPDDTQRWGLQRRRAEALAEAGRPGESAELFGEAADALASLDPNDPALPDLRRAAAEQSLRGGRIVDGLDRLSETLDDAGLRWPATPLAAMGAVVFARLRLRARGLSVAQPPDAAPAHVLRKVDACWTAAMGLCWVDSIRSAVFQNRYAVLALNLGEPSRAVRALATEAAFLANEGGAANRRRAEQALQDAFLRAELLGDEATMAIVDICASAVAFFSADFARASEHAEVARERLDRAGTGLTWEGLNCDVFGLWAQAWQGDLGGLKDRLEDRLAAARDRGDLLAAATLSVGLPGLAWLAADRPDLALRRADDAMALWTHHKGFHTQHYMNLVARVQVDLYQGDGAAAWTRVAETWPRLKQAQMLRLQYIRMDVTFLRGRAGLAALRDGPDATIRRSIVRDAKTLRAEDAAWGEALGAALLGGLSVIEGRPDEAALLGAREAADAVRLRLLRAALDRALGRPVGWLEKRGVVDTDRLLDVLLPAPRGGDDA